MKEYNKLVRDKIPAYLESKDIPYRSHTATEEEYATKLLEKLREEADEFSKDRTEEELADLLEVVDAIYDHFQFQRESVETIRQKKLADRGGFKARIILEAS